MDKEVKKKIAIGIPFLASSHIKALQLALLSINKYIGDVDVCILLDCSNKELSEQFNVIDVLKCYPSIKFKYYTAESGRGKYKQALIDWCCLEMNYEYVIIMHSDVFFYKNNILETLIEPLIKNNEYIATYWEMPLSEYKSTFHIGNNEKRMIIAPRICTWLFALNVARYREYINSNMDEREYAPFHGHYHFDINEENKYIKWIRDNYNSQVIEKYEYIFFDIGTFFRYDLDKKYIKGFSLGEEINPSFDSLKLKYRKEGFVHIEQFDPERFNDIFYKKDLLTERENILDEIMVSILGG